MAEQYNEDASTNLPPAEQNEVIGMPSPKRMKLEPENLDEAELDHEIEACNEFLHKILTKNVELHEEETNAINILRTITRENQDLLEALLATEPDLSKISVPPAPLVELTKEQENDFEVQTGWS